VTWSDFLRDIFPAASSFAASFAKPRLNAAANAYRLSERVHIDYWRFFFHQWMRGPMARRLTTNQEILGSIPSVFIFIILPDIAVSGTFSFWHVHPRTELTSIPLHGRVSSPSRQFNILWILTNTPT
jgi:hypothetical protein